MNRLAGLAAVVCLFDAALQIGGIFAGGTSKIRRATAQSTSFLGCWDCGLHDEDRVSEVEVRVEFRRQ